MRNKFNLVPDEVINFAQNIRKMPTQALREQSRDTLILASGAMADTMEKRDHMDDKDSRIILTRNIIRITEMLIHGSKHLSFDIVQAALERRSKIAALKIT